MEYTARIAMQGTWRTGAPCIMSDQEDFILVLFRIKKISFWSNVFKMDHFFRFDKRVLSCHELPKKSLTLKGHCK